MLFIMPDHIHMIVVLDNSTAGAPPRPTLTDIICVYKSLTTRMCKNAGFGENKFFQNSFFDHVIRNTRDYEEIWEYIDSNPYRWIEKLNQRIKITGEQK